MKSARVLLKLTATCSPDVTQQRNIILWKPDKLNLSTSTYLIPFQEEQKSAKQSRRIIKSAEDSLSKTKSCFPGRLSRFLSRTLLNKRTGGLRTEYKMGMNLNQ